MNKDVTLKQVLLEQAEATYDITEILFQQVGDEDLPWKPGSGKNWMTTGQLLMHCASFGCGKAIQGFVKGDWGLPENADPEDMEATNHVPPASAMPAVDSVTEALELLTKDRILAFQCLKDINEDQLLAERFAAPWGGPELTLFQHLLLMIQHLAQHKGQLFYYLKLIGRDVDTGNLWGNPD